MASTPHAVPPQYQAPYKSLHQTDPKTLVSHHGYQYSSLDNGSDHTEEYLSQTRSIIGWTTPLTMAITFLAATTIAIAHFLYCHFMNNKFVQSTIPQSWNNAISVAFAQAFSTALAASASTAFTQLLWWYLRRQPLSLSKIDALFSLNTSPLNLYQLGFLKTTPLLWFFGLLLPLISVVTIFPPGSLVVQQLPEVSNYTAEVPTLDVDYRGNGSAADFFSHAMFTHGSDGEYRWPDVRYSGIGKRTLLEGSYLRRPSPCGVNCSYSLTFAAPSLRCQDNSPNQGLEEKIFEYYSNNTQDEGAHSIWNAGAVDYMAAPYSLGHQFIFNISYRGRDTNSLNNISCTTLAATYTAHIQYVNSIQNVTVDVIDGEPLNASILGLSSLFYDVINSEPTATGFKYSNTPLRNFTMDELSNIYRGVQLRTMRDTLVRPMSGALSAFGTENYFTINTIIQETTIAETVYNESMYTFSDIFFNLSPSVVEELMRNVTISLLNDAEYNKSTLITTTIYKSGYVFKDHARLIGSYAGALAICLMFILLGLGALVQNGTSATSNGFLQILCTTTYGEGTMNQLAREASFGGAENVSKELAALKVRFGVVTDSNSERKYAAFGTVDETETLLKGLQRT